MAERKVVSSVELNVWLTGPRAAQALVDGTGSPTATASGWIHAGRFLRESTASPSTGKCAKFDVDRDEACAERHSFR